MSNPIFEADALHRRGEALENEFFHRVDEKLRADLRRTMQRDESRDRLAMVTGIQDKDLLDHLLDAEITPTSIASLSLVPLVFVAWADGNVTAAERKTIIQAASQQGTFQQPSTVSLLENWLLKRPERSLWDLWKSYSDAMHQTLPSQHANALRCEILRSATNVAKASGGYFGRGTISAAEKEVLDQIAEALPAEA